MKKSKTNFFENLFYNNKFLMVFSLVMAIVLWAFVKVNYSEIATRVISDVKVTLETSNETDYIPFYNEEDLSVSVEVSGRSYNINTYSLKRDDIVVEATVPYVDSAGYKQITLTARAADNDVQVLRITPSIISVFYDRSTTQTFNVEARLLNEESQLQSEGYIIGQPVPSASTVDVTGPATVLEKIEKVYFDAKLNAKQLPLTATTELNATISYGLEHENEADFLVCEGIGNGGSTATVTVPVNRLATVDTTVKFVNQPAYFDENPPKISISPSQVRLSYNAEDGTDVPTAYNIGTVDFSTLQNKVNKLTLTADEKNVQLLDNVSAFDVRIDLSGFSSKLIDATKSNVVFLNQKAEYKYTANLEDIGLNRVRVIGSAASLKKLQPEDLQIEINVSALSRPSNIAHAVKITNISIQSKSVNDCWISGSYRARVQMVEK